MGRVWYQLGGCFLVMDLVCKFFEPYTFDIWFPNWSHTSLTRQYTEILFFLTLGGWAIYLFGAGIDYLLFFDKAWLKHKKMLPNQLPREIWSLWNDHLSLDFS